MSFSGARTATWTGRLTDRDLASTFDAATLQRAHGYAHEGALLRVTASGAGEVILADVQGTRPRPYQCLVTVTGSVDDQPVAFTTRCSCPVETGCKHAAALLLGLREEHRPAVVVESPWREALGELARRDAAEGIDRARGEVETEELPGLGVFVSVLKVAPRGWGESSRTAVHLRGTRMGRAGRWVRNLRWEALRGGPAGYAPLGAGPAPMVRPEHARLVDELLETRRRHRRGVGPGDGQVVDLDDLGPDRWAWVRRAVAAGVELVPLPGTSESTLDPESLDVVVTVTEGNEGLRLGVHLAGTQESAAAPVLVGSPPHSVVLTGQDGGQVVRPLDGTAPELVALAGEPVSTVPREDVPELLADYLPVLRRHARVVSPDGSVDVTASSRLRLVARVASPDLGTIEIEWGVEVVTGADDTGAVGPLRPLGQAPLRHEERELLLAVPGLAELPDAMTRIPASVLSGRSRFTGVDALRVVTLCVPLLEVDERVRLEEVGVLPGYREAEDEPVLHLAVAETDSSDWFDLQVGVSVDDEEVPLGDLLAALAAGDPLLLLPSGTWFSLDRPELSRLRELLAEAREMHDPQRGTVRVSRFDIGYVEELVDLGVLDAQALAWEQQVSRLRSVEVDPAPPPPGQLTATLRPYQADGYQWLSALWDAGLGGVLADDMGLGKTLQVLSMLARAQERGDLDGPVLVVAPTSVVSTWADEARRFTPGLKVITRARTEAKSRRALRADVSEADVVVTSYAVARLDADVFAEITWRALVLDEAHTVKNHRSQTYRAVRALRRDLTFAVTGTPVENNLMDLWSLLSLVAPGLHPRADHFAARWRRPIERGDRELLATLRRRIRPLMLRRTKDEVALDLPPKTVQVLPVVLAPGHRRLYERHLQRERQRMLGLLDDPEANRVAILASLTRLRQLALDPRLVPALVDAQGAGTPTTATSAKIDVLVEYLEEIRTEGHRALVFSQFTSFLALVRARLDEAGIGHCYLDGSTTDRQQVVDSFRTGDDPAFLISLKAGGVGLTLTEADYVFVLDPWWNPAAEAQAIDRAHRIGQDRPVMVYRLVAAETIEEKVIALQDRKRELVARVVDDDPLTGGLTADDLAALLEPGP